MLSAAGQMLGLDSADYGRSDLLQRRSDEIDDVERKRKEAASGYSPAGMAAFGLLSVTKGIGQ
jgi:hypothetical protein